MAYRRTEKVQRRLDAQRDALVDAAAALLAEGGCPSVSVAAVAERAEVAVGTVYRHFAGKAGLVVEVFRRIVSKEVAAVEQVSASPGDPVERAATVLETFARRAMKTPRQAYALLAEPVDPEVEAERLVFRRAYRDVLAAHIRAGVRSGHLPAQDADVTAAALVGATAEVLIGPLTSGNTEIVPELRTFTLRALGGHDGRDT
ncbi:TetR family transcriptional regulator [Allosaccharopolyspora coralli]|uniref:TetR family transcriptional regulator n=1 Tax=Allosaccharopolyspora coralli TaxID=2665642 RepID=A0A5Q3QBL3_9PSEU|nr:TetR/AcrR family transcriptional regulator [Allosaccharopolyspora coralli]QGK70756.1 TetR family transcriptional regulator [Allosaccharopolyspora coralli]